MLTLKNIVVTAIMLSAGYLAPTAAYAVEGDLNCGLNTGEVATGTPIPLGGIVGRTGPQDCPSSYKMEHQSGLSFGGSGSLV